MQQLLIRVHTGVLDLNYLNKNNKINYGDLIK